MMRLRIASILCLGLLALASPAVAADDPAGTEIHLTQEATRTVTPDRIRVTLRVEVKGKDGRAVQAEINRRVAAALDKAKDATEIKAETGSYTVYRDSSVSSGSKPVLDEWRGDETVILTAKDFAAALALAGELQGDGLLMSGSEFFVAPETLRSAQSELTASALGGLRARAQEVAQALGMTVQRYKSITVGNATTTGPILRGFNMAGAPAASPMPPPVAQAGEQTIMLTVEGDVLLMPTKT